MTLPDEYRDEAWTQPPPCGTDAAPDCVRIDSELYFGQLPLLRASFHTDETGGIQYQKEAFQKDLLFPLWMVTSFRLAKN
jgi:hypothetical protein